MSFYDRKKEVNPKLLKPFKYPTIAVLQVPTEYYPFIIEELRTNDQLSIMRAMNYSRVLYGNLGKIPLNELLDLMDPIMHTSRAVVFFLCQDPSTFTGYCYRYSRFLHYVLVSSYRDKCKVVADITCDMIHDYLYSEARRGMQGSTVRGLLPAIKYMLSNFEIYQKIDQNKVMFKQLFQLVFKIFARPVKKRKAFGYTLMVKVLEKINFKVLIDVRDWCIFIVIHVAGFRGGEISRTKWVDVIVDSYTNTFTGQKVNVVVIFLESTKTQNQSDDIVVTISCPSEISSFNMLPVLKQYILLLKKKKLLNTWMFPSLQRRDFGLDKHITTATVRNIFKKRAKEVNEDPTLYGAHSGRMAFVTDAIAAGIPAEFIKKTGRWTSQCWRGYFHDAQYAQVMATEQMNEFSKSFTSKKATKKHQELAQLMHKKCNKIFN